MPKFNWDGVPKQAIVDTLKKFDAVPDKGLRQAKEGLVEATQTFLRDNPGKIDKFFRLLREAAAKPAAEEKPESVEEGA